MCWDRFLLASGFTLYLLLGHSLDTEDYDYLKEQYELKEEQLWQSRLRWDSKTDHVTQNMKMCALKKGIRVFLNVKNPAKKNAWL